MLEGHVVTKSDILVSSGYFGFHSNEKHMNTYIATNEKKLC